MRHLLDRERLGSGRKSPAALRDVARIGRGGGKRLGQAEDQAALEAAAQGGLTPHLRSSSGEFLFVLGGVDHIRDLG